MKVVPNVVVNKVAFKGVEKPAEKCAEASHNNPQVNDLGGMNAVAGASQVKHVMHIGPGSPILDKAAAIISKDGPAQLKVATEAGSVMDIWSGREVPYDKGNIVMYYGTYDFDDPYVSDNAKEKYKALGEPCVHDYNRSVDPDLMRETYVDAKTGKYLIETGQLEAGKAPVDAIKRAKGGCLIMPAGTKVHTLETIEHKLPPVEVLPGQVVALDHRGNPYVQDMSQMIKRNKPNSPEAQVLFDKMSDFINYRNEIKSAYADNDAEYEKCLKSSWAEFVRDCN